MSALHARETDFHDLAFLAADFFWRVSSFDEKRSSTADAYIPRVAPVEIDGVGCLQVDLDILGTDESDFLCHREKELEAGTIFHLSHRHHRGDAYAVIGSECRAVSAQDFPIIEDSDTFGLEVVCVVGDTDHIHMGLQADEPWFRASRSDEQVSRFVCLVRPIVSLGPCYQPIPHELLVLWATRDT